MTAEPRDVEEIRAAQCGFVFADACRCALTSEHELPHLCQHNAPDVAARLAAADRENAELRAAILRNVDTHADLSTQLAAAQAQLAEARDTVWRLRGVEARLEAVRAVCSNVASDLTTWVAETPPSAVWKAPIIDARHRLRQAAALSAAPQPEPDECPACRRDRTKAGVTCHRTPADGWVCERALTPPASDEPARCEHGFTAWHWISGHYSTGRWSVTRPESCPSGGAK